jgi:hypothetical protein
MPLILHELAHAYTSTTYDYFEVQGHGPEWCTIYLDLLALFYSGRAAAALAKNFVDKKVKFNGLEWR